MMPVSMRLQVNLCTNKPDLRAETLHKDPHQVGLPTVEIGVQEDWNITRNTHDTNDMPIPNVPIGLPLGVAPSPTLLQQHKDVSELREQLSKLSDNQASMMDFLQSLIEPHPDRNLDFSQEELKDVSVLWWIDEELKEISEGKSVSIFE